MPILESLDKVKQYQHSHEYLGKKVMRRVFLEDRGSKTDSTARKFGRFFAYSVPSIACAWGEVPVVGHAGRLFEKAGREAFGNGTSRANQAKDFYDACQTFLSSQSEANFLKILAIYEKRICDTTWYRGASKTLKPLAKEVLEAILHEKADEVMSFSQRVQVKLKNADLNVSRHINRM